MPNHRTAAVKLLQISVFVLAATACGRPARTGADRIKASYDDTSGRLTKLAYDADGDGKAETWGYMDGVRVIRLEADENNDSQIDRWEYHRNVPNAKSPANPLDTVERIERATRYDGKVSRWEFFDQGALIRVEEDTSGDGKVDKWETYANGSLVSMALDTTGRGQPDRRLLYKADGSFDRVETIP